MIIDCHVHLLPPWRLAKLIGWVRRSIPDHPVPDDVSLEALLPEWAELGIDYLWNFAHAVFPEETDELNRWNAELARRHSGVIPLATVHPALPDAAERLARTLDGEGFIGVKFHPFVQRFVPWEPRYLPIYEAIAARGRLVVFHTGLEAFYDGRLPLGGFEAILRAFPELVVVFAHANFPEFDEAFDLVARYPNLYLDTVHVFSALTDHWARGADMTARRRRLREGLLAFPDRVMFGSDHPAGMGTLRQIYADVEAFELPLGVREALLGGTARRLVEGVRPGFFSTIRPLRPRQTDPTARPQ